MPYDNERLPENEDKKEEMKKQEDQTKKAGKKYMFDPQPLEEGKLAEWEQ